MDGDAPEKVSAYVETVRDNVTSALNELIDQGARIRPLILDGRQAGFIRGVHGSERRQLAEWYPDPEMRTLQLLAHGTSLSYDEIETLNGAEAQNLVRLIDRMTDSDVSLYPYVSAFATTSVSEMLWHGRGIHCASWSRTKLEIPGGWEVKLLAPPDHARLWAGVASMRERSKRRLDDTYNAAMITRALVGKGADRLYQSLKKTLRTLKVDALEPWTSLVKEESTVNVNDGWGHAMQDDSAEGLFREMEGMTSDDRHERVMSAFYDQQMAAAREVEEEIEQDLGDALFGVEDVATILTSYQVHQMEESIRSQRAHDASVVQDFMTHADDDLERRENRSMGRGEPPRL